MFVTFNDFKISLCLDKTIHMCELEIQLKNFIFCMWMCDLDSHLYTNPEIDLLIPL